MREGARDTLAWHCTVAAFFALTILFTAGIGHAIPLEVYGKLPSIEEVALSPDGSRIATVRTIENKRVIAVSSLEDRKLLGLMQVGEEKLRRIEWADNDHLMIRTSKTTVPSGMVGMESEWQQLLVYDVIKHDSLLVPDTTKTRALHAALDTPYNFMNVVTGPVMVRRVDGHTVLFVHGAYVERRVLPALFRVDLDTGGQKLIQTGSAATGQWLVDSTGQIVAEQDYDDESGLWSLRTQHDGKLEIAATRKEPIDYPRLLGFGPRPDTLLLQVIENGEGVWQVFDLKERTFGSPMEEARALGAPIVDPTTNRTIGGVYVEDDARYVFFDPVLQNRWMSILHAFGGSHVRFVAASEDFKKIVVRVDGPQYGYRYELVDLDAHKADPVGDIYEGLTEPLEVRRVTYAAADGLEIPAYLTLPRGRALEKLPLVVLPHGGPAVRDTADFDWWSQALADQGYAVLRPNYRGSTISARFLAAGFGEYGRKMQTDLSDGVRFLVKQGVVDPARVCIVGASYGGYAALAGVTLDPGVYRCAVSVAGISDLRRKLQWVNEKHWDSNNMEQRFWDRFLGVTGPDDPVLEQISPIRHIDGVKVPVLLIHGRDDTVVPFEQSDDMYEALRKAKKDVEFVELKNEDHWLSRSETRLQMLRATVAFLRAHNPPD